MKYRERVIDGVIAKCTDFPCSFRTSSGPVIVEGNSGVVLSEGYVLRQCQRHHVENGRRIFEDHNVFLLRRKGKRIGSVCVGGGASFAAGHIEIFPFPKLRGLSRPAPRGRKREKKINVNDYLDS